jgi:hypothetical protein
VLRAPRAAVRDVTFPRYSFDNGMNLRVDGKSYRLSFIEPQNTKLPKPRPDNPVEGVAEAGLEFLDIAHELSAARAVGQAWKKALALA